MIEKNSIKHHYWKDDFYSHLNMEDNTDADCVQHTKRVCKEFWNKKLRKLPWFVCSKQYIFVLDHAKVHSIYWYAKANNKYMKDYGKNKYIHYWHVNNLYGWAMSQKLSASNFELIEVNSQFNEDFIKNYIYCRKW